MEIIFVLGAIFIAYVVHDKVTGGSKEESVTTEKPGVSVVENTNKKQEKAVVEKKKPAAKKTKAIAAKPKPATAKPKAKAASKSKTATKATLPTGSVKDPETGDMVKLANTYQMMRRWIKEALVTEGLLEKIYKTNEMDDAVEAKIAEALSKLQKMDKYQ